MTVHYAFLALALLLLWFPRNWLRHGLRVLSGPSRRSSRAARADEELTRDPHDRGVKPLAEAGKSRNWIDLMRAGVGAYGVTMVALRPPVGSEQPDVMTIACQGAVLAIATLVQMVRLEGRVSLFAPIFFLQGMTLGVAGWLVGALAMIGTWALSPVLPGAGAMLFVQGGVALSLGLLLQSPSTEPVLLMVLTGVIWMPVLASVLLRKRISAAFDKRVKTVSRGRGERERDPAAERAQVEARGG